MASLNHNEFRVRYGLSYLKASLRGPVTLTTTMMYLIANWCHLYTDSIGFIRTEFSNATAPMLSWLEQIRWNHGISNHNLIWYWLSWRNTLRLSLETQICVKENLVNIGSVNSVGNTPLVKPVLIHSNLSIGNTGNKIKWHFDKNKNKKPPQFSSKKILFWHQCVKSHQYVNTLRPRQNGRHFADDTFKPIFLNENFRISIKISLKFVPKVPINNIPSLVQINHLKQCRVDHWRIYASLGLSELKATNMLSTTP